MPQQYNVPGYGPMDINEVLRMAAEGKKPAAKYQVNPATPAPVASTSGIPKWMQDLINQYGSPSDVDLDGNYHPNPTPEQVAAGISNPRPAPFEGGEWSGNGSPGFKGTPGIVDWQWKPDAPPGYTGLPTGVSERDQMIRRNPGKYGYHKVQVAGPGGKMYDTWVMPDKNLLAANTNSPLSGRPLVNPGSLPPEWQLLPNTANQGIGVQPAAYGTRSGAQQQAGAYVQPTGGTFSRRSGFSWMAPRMPGAAIPGSYNPALGQPQKSPYAAYGLRR